MEESIFKSIKMFLGTDALFHYGIKGMHWGIRRYQNADGTLTSAGKSRLVYRNRVRNAYNTSNYVNSIINTMDKSEKKKLGIENGEEYLTFEQGSQVAKRIIESDEAKIPVSFFDLLEEGDTINVSIGTRSDKKYRGKGYASRAAKKGMEWYDKNKEKFGYKQIVWGVRTDNEPSIRIAKKHGFTIDEDSYSDDGKWVNYVRR